MTLIFSLDGNIGSGKSTLLKRLQESYENDIIFLTEPVDIWQGIKDEEGNDMLTKFYGDLEKYSFHFQMMAYISRLEKLINTLKQNPDAIIITERSIFTDRYVFAKMLYDSGNMESVSYTIYQKWFDTFSDGFNVDGYIYVNTSPEKCFERMKKRDRDGESVSIDYLTSCGDYHEKWLADKDNLLVLDCDCEFETNDDQYRSMLNSINEFMLDIKYTKEHKPIPNFTAQDLKDHPIM